VDPAIAGEGEDLKRGIGSQERAVLPVDLHDPAQRRERIEVQQAVLRQGVELGLGLGAEACQSVREQHDELRTLAPQALIPLARVGREPPRQAQQHSPAGTASRQPGRRLADPLLVFPIASPALPG
jgi:hypothetical protein